MEMWMWVLVIAAVAVVAVVAWMLARGVQDPPAAAGLRLGVRAHDGSDG